MYCQNCGMQLDENAKFCSNCGRPVKNSNDTFYSAYFNTAAKDFFQGVSDLNKELSSSISEARREKAYRKDIENIEAVRKALDEIEKMIPLPISGPFLQKRLEKALIKRNTLRRDEIRKFRGVKTVNGAVAFFEFEFRQILSPEQRLLGYECEITPEERISLTEYLNSWKEQNDKALLLASGYQNDLIFPKVVELQEKIDRVYRGDISEFIQLQLKRQTILKVERHYSLESHFDITLHNKTVFKVILHNHKCRIYDSNRNLLRIIKKAYITFKNPLSFNTTKPVKLSFFSKGETKEIGTLSYYSDIFESIIRPVIDLDYNGFKIENYVLGTNYRITKAGEVIAEIRMDFWDDFLLFKDNITEYSVGVYGEEYALDVIMLLFAMKEIHLVSGFGQ